MQITKNDELNNYIYQLHDLIMAVVPHVVFKELPGYRSNQYGKGESMKNGVCYIICYDQKANLGFDHGIDLQAEFPMLKGTGKFHRHLEITQAFIQNKPFILSLIKRAFELSNK